MRFHGQHGATAISTNSAPVRVHFVERDPHLELVLSRRVEQFAERLGGDVDRATQARQLALVHRAGRARPDRHRQLQVLAAERVVRHARPLAARPGRASARERAHVRLVLGLRTEGAHRAAAALRSENQHGVLATRGGDPPWTWRHCGSWMRPGAFAPARLPAAQATARAARRTASQPPCPRP